MTFIERYIEENTIDHFRKNSGKYLAGVGALGAGYLGNEYLDTTPEFTNNAKMFGDNIWNTWTSNLPNSIKPTVTGVAWDNAINNFQHDIDPTKAVVHGAIELPTDGSSKQFNLRSDFIGIPSESIKDGEVTKDFRAYFNKEDYDKNVQSGLTFGGRYGI